MAQTFNGNVIVDGVITANNLRADNNSLIDGKLNISDLLNKIYPVGSIYMSITNTSPASFIGGTWTKIIDDAYLKIVTSGAGSLGGTNSQHKIPKECMAKHNHGIPTSNGVQGNACYETPMHFSVSQTAVNFGWSTSSNGDPFPYNAANGYLTGQPYYPYYYGVYAWRRTA